MEKKNNKGIVVALVVAIFIILGLGGYIIYDKVLSTEKESKQEESKKEEVNKDEKEKYEEVSIDDEIVTKLIKNVTADTIDVKTAGYFYEKGKILNTEVSNQMKLYLAIQMIQGNPDEMEKNLSKVTPENIASAVKEIFGPDATYTDETLNDACRGMKYNSKTQKYSAYYGCGGALIPTYHGTIVKARKYNDRLEIDQKAMLITYEQSKTNTGDIIINIFNPNDKIDSFEIKSDDDWPEAKDLLEKYKDKLATYKYTFNLEDGNYYFYSVEKVEG